MLYRVAASQPVGQHGARCLPILAPEGQQREVDAKSATTARGGATLSRQRAPRGLKRGSAGGSRRPASAFAMGPPAPQPGARTRSHVQVVVTIGQGSVRQAKQTEDEEEDEGALRLRATAQSSWAPASPRRRRRRRQRGWKSASTWPGARPTRIRSEARTVGPPPPPSPDHQVPTSTHCRGVREPGPVDGDDGGGALGGEAREQLSVDLSRTAGPRGLLRGEAIQVDQPQVGEVADGADVVGHHGGARGQALHQEAHLVLLLVDVLDRGRGLPQRSRRGRSGAGTRQRPGRAQTRAVRGRAHGRRAPRPVARDEHDAYGTGRPRIGRHPTAAICKVQQRRPHESGPTCARRAKRKQRGQGETAAAARVCASRYQPAAHGPHRRSADREAGPFECRARQASIRHAASLRMARRGRGGGATRRRGVTRGRGRGITSSTTAAGAIRTRLVSRGVARPPPSPAI